MNKAEQYRNILDLRAQIDERLQAKQDIASIQALLTWADESALFQRFYQKDTMLRRVVVYGIILRREQKMLLPLGVKGNIFDNVTSLAEMKEKYDLIDLTCLRIENRLPDEICRQGLDELIQRDISGVAIEFVVSLMQADSVRTIVWIANYFLERGEGIRALTLLLSAKASHPGNREILLPLANLYLEAGDAKLAYETLSEIAKPNAEELSLIEELGRIV